MNHRERFISALRGKQPDRVPIFESTISELIVGKLASLLQIEPNATSERPFENELPWAIKGTEYIELYCSVLEKLDLDAVSHPVSRGLEKTSGNQGRDKYGRVYNLSPHGEPYPAAPRVRNLSEAEKFDMASILEPEDFSDLRLVVERFGGKRACCTPLSDPFKESWRSTGGMEHFLLSFRENPRFVHRLLRATTDYILKTIDMAVDVGIDAFLMGGDFAGETSLLFSLDDYRNYIRPRETEIVEHVHRKGALIIKHSDGNVWALLDEWMQVGFDGIHPIQPQCMDIKEVKDHLNGKMAVLGNIDCRHLLVSGSEKDVKKVVRETIEKVAPGGGYIVTSSNCIHSGCRPENYIAMVEAAHQYGAY